MGKPRIPCGQGLGLDGVCNGDDLCAYCGTIILLQDTARDQEDRITSLKRRLDEAERKVGRAREVDGQNRKRLKLLEMAIIYLRTGQPSAGERGLMTYKEIGAALGISAAWARDLSCYAYNKMARATGRLEEAERRKEQPPPGEGT